MSDNSLSMNIKGIKVNAIIGIYKAERIQKQPLIIDITCKFRTCGSLNSDNISDTLDYSILTNEIINKVEKSKFNLLEQLIDYILSILLSYPHIQKATVSVAKPKALAEKGAIVSICGKRNRKSN